MDDKRVARPDIELQDLIPEFLVNRQKEMPLLQGYLRNHDYDSIGKLGHTLKGICASFGFEYLGVLGQDLESAALAKSESSLNMIANEMSEYLRTVEVVYTSKDDRG